MGSAVGGQPLEKIFLPDTKGLFILPNLPVLHPDWVYRLFSFIMPPLIFATFPMKPFAENI
ncbi:TPA: paraquat-inducible membrane protein A, partial [Neisseria meningitidis]